MKGGGGLGSDGQISNGYDRDGFGCGGGDQEEAVVGNSR